MLAVGGGGRGGRGQFQIDNIERYFAHVEGHVLPDAGHWLPEEAPAAIADLVLGFLGAGRTLAAAT